MKTINKNFKYSFNSSACASCKGNCCIGESGYIWINTKEIQLLANCLKISEYELISNKLKNINGRYSIKETKLSKNNYACVFFDTNKRACSIYDARPLQCRTFPFWDYYKDENNLGELKKECLGVIENEKK